MRTKTEQPRGNAASAPMPGEFADRNIHWLLPGVLVLALVCRAWALFAFSKSVYGDYLLYDERVYQDWAISLLQGTRFVVHDFSPLPAYLMAALYRIVTPDPVSVRVMNIVLGVSSCYFIYLIGRDLTTRRAGLLAALLAALYKPFIFFSITLLKESLVVFLFSLTVFLFVSLYSSPGNRAPAGSLPVSRSRFRPSPLAVPGAMPGAWGKALLLGIAAGLLINVRQNSLVLLPVFPILLLWAHCGEKPALQRAARIVAIYLLGLTVAITPFLVRNYRLTGDASSSPAGGFNLYLANNLENPYPYYRPVAFATSVPSQQAAQFVIEAGRRTGKKLSPSEASAYWTQKVIRTAREQPAAMLGKLWQKTLALVNQSEAEDNYHLGFTSRFVLFFRLPFPAYWFVFPIGFATLLFRSRDKGVSAALLIIAAVYALTLIVFFSNMRIRIPLLVILVPFAAIGADALMKWIGAGHRFGRRQALILATIAILGAAEFLPVPGAGDLSAYYNTHALNLYSKGLRQEALQYWRDAADMDRPYSAYANIALASACYQENNWNEGDRRLERIPDTSFAAASKYELLGDRWMKRKNPGLAAAAYERALTINSGLLEPRKKLIRILERTDPAKSAREKELLTYIESFYQGIRDQE